MIAKAETERLFESLKARKEKDPAQADVWADNHQGPLYNTLV